LNRWFESAAWTNTAGIRLSCPHVRYWLMKSEPDEFSIDDLVRRPKKTTPWFGVRNYQARNFMRDDMRVGDGVLFYHSSCPSPASRASPKVASSPYPDASQFDRRAPTTTRRRSATSRAGCWST
jgi:predicted RNA-binding protein with PUA-like domain